MRTQFTRILTDFTQHTLSAALSLCGLILCDPFGLLRRVFIWLFAQWPLNIPRTLRTRASAHRVLDALPPVTTQTTITVVVPTFNERSNIERTLRALNLSATPHVNVIIADGGSHDGTQDFVTQLAHRESWAIRLVRCNVDNAKGRKGRAYSLNGGSRYATGDILLFLHADTILPLNWADLARESMAKKHENWMGAFNFALDEPEQFFPAWKTWPFVTVTRWRAKYRQLPYGDQALFMRRSLFEHLGRFPSQPFMEDVQLVKDVGRLGHIDVLPEPALTSARRFASLGLYRTVLTNQLVIFGYNVGIDSTILRTWYYE